MSLCCLCFSLKASCRRDTPSPHPLKRFPVRTKPTDRCAQYEHLLQPAPPLLNKPLISHYVVDHLYSNTYLHFLSIFSSFLLCLACFLLSALLFPLFFLPTLYRSVSPFCFISTSVKCFLPFLQSYLIFILSLSSPCFCSSCSSSFPSPLFFCSFFFSNCSQTNFTLISCFAFGTAAHFTADICRLNIWIHHLN